jgi:hypothetical protein
MKVEMARLNSENRDLNRENKENVMKHEQDLEQMKDQYKEVISMSKE